MTVRGSRAAALTKFMVITIVAGALGLPRRSAGLSEPTDPEVIAALVEAHNRERAKEKLAPLKANAKLNAAALAHARDMAEHEKMAHEGSDGSTPIERIERQAYLYETAGENVAKGQEDVDEVMRVWLNSPPHKKGILGDFTEMGAARVDSADGTAYWCVDFGKPWPVLDPAKAEAEVIERINRERAKTDLKPVKPHPRLQAAARRHVHLLVDRGRLRKGKTPDPLSKLVGPGYRNVFLSAADASGQPKPEDLLETWLGDKAMRETILGDFRDVGVGYATDDKGHPYWSLILGRPLR